MIDINSVITKEEYEATRELTYDQFCNYLIKLVKLCTEESLKALPTVITHLTNQAAYLKNLTNKFYKTNPDLAKNRKLVARVIEKVEAENPGMTYEELLKESAARARKIIPEMARIPKENPKDLKTFDKRLNDL